MSLLIEYNLIISRMGEAESLRLLDRKTISRKVEILEWVYFIPEPEIYTEQGDEESRYVGLN